MKKPPIQELTIPVFLFLGLATRLATIPLLGMILVIQTGRAAAGFTLADLDIKVLVITFETRAFARAYVQDTRLRWPVLIDEPRALYHAYGMLRGSWWDIWGPRTWWAYAKELTPSPSSRSRNAGHPAPPPQIRTCGITASGSSLG